MTVPYAFGAATSAIPLSQLDSNFNTPITLGNTAIQLGNTVTTLNNMTLANVTISSGNVTITNVTVTTANATTVNTTTLIATTANVTTGNVTNLISGNVSLTGGSITGTPISGSTGSFTTLTTSGTVTLNGGTANGVAYLDGSKVLTSGSGLVFDGSNLGLGVTPSATNTVTVFQNKNTSYSALNENLYLSANAFFATGWKYITTGESTQYRQTAGQHQWWNAASGTAGNAISFTQAMTLDSDGDLGIGTTSPGAKVHAFNASGTNALILENGANGGVYAQWKRPNREYYLALDINNNGSNDFSLYDATAAATRLTVDSSGNLGLGVTPSAWGSGYKAIQVGPTSALWNPTAGYAQLSDNSYVDSAGTSRYIVSKNAATFSVNRDSGAFAWFTAPSGTAGNAISFTQAMTLDASGNLGVGTTSPQARISAGTGTGKKILAYDGGASQAQSGLGTDMTGESNQVCLFGGTNTSSGSIISFGHLNTSTNAYTERARITSGGEFLVGKTVATYTTDGVTLAASGGSNFSNTSAAVVAINRNGTDGSVIDFYKSGTGVGSISVTGSATAYNTSSDYRLKDNQQPLTGSGAFIDALQPKTWEWKADGSKGVGFIAHEVQAVSPGSVVGTKDAVDEEGNPIMQAMEYGSAEFIANIIAELQSLRARVAQLESKGA